MKITHYTFQYIKPRAKSLYGRKEMLYLTTRSTHFIYGYMASVMRYKYVLV